MSITNIDELESRESFRQYLQGRMSITRWSRAELARRSGVSAESLKKYFAGECQPGKGSARKVRAAFEMVGL